MPPVRGQRVEMTPQVPFLAVVIMLDDRTLHVFAPPGQGARVAFYDGTGALLTDTVVPAGEEVKLTTYATFFRVTQADPA